MFDFSNFSKDSKCYDSQNEMVVGKMKVVYEGNPINKFSRLKSKMYSMLSDDGNESSKAKGVNIATEFYSIKHKSNTKWKEFKVKNKKLEHKKSTKYHSRVLIIKDLF